MNTQLNIFPSPKKAKPKGNPYRSLNGMYCSKEESEKARLLRENKRLKQSNSFLKNQAEMYERMALSLSSRVSEYERKRTFESVGLRP